jgi:hypothetical protein
MKRLLLCSLAAGAVLALPACGTEQISKGDIQTKTQAYFDGLAKKNGQAKFPDIKCPDDLEAKKGKSTRCSAKGTDGTLGITVTVTEVRDDGVTMSFKADDKLTK